MEKTDQKVTATTTKKLSKILAFVTIIWLVGVVFWMLFDPLPRVSSDLHVAGPYYFGVAMGPTLIALGISALFSVALKRFGIDWKRTFVTAFVLGAATITAVTYIGRADSLISSTSSILRNMQAPDQRYERGAVELDDSSSQTDLEVRAYGGDPEAQFRLAREIASLDDPMPTDMSEAMRLYRLAAEQGHSEAMEAIAWVHIDGKYVPKDYQEARRWFLRASETLGPGFLYKVSNRLGWFGGRLGEGDAERDALYIELLSLAADQGYVEAHKTLGHWYFAKDRERGLDHFRKAAMLGDIHSQWYLGALFDLGRIVPKNDGESFKWHSMAAQQGDASSQSSLAFMYADGRGVQRDLVEAYKWINLAISGRSGSAPEENSEMRKMRREIIKSEVEFRDALARRMTTEQVARAQELSRQWQSQNR